MDTTATHNSVARHAALGELPKNDFFTASCPRTSEEPTERVISEIETAGNNGPRLYNSEKREAPDHAPISGLDLVCVWVKRMR